MNFRIFHLLFLFLFCFSNNANAQVLNDFIPFYNTHPSYNDGAPYLMPFGKGAQKDNEGNYYFLFYDICNETFLDDNKVDCIEWEGVEPSRLHHYLVKVNPNLEIDTFISIKGLNKYLDLELAVCDDFVFVSYFNWLGTFDSIYIVNDTLLDASEGGVLQFDLNLNFKREILSLDKEVSNIACIDKKLFVQAYLRDNKDRNEHFTVINNDTLWNFNAESRRPSERTPFILSYDLGRDTIDHFWKLGSDGRCDILDMGIDSNGNIMLIFDAFWATWFFFNDPDTIKTGQYRGDYFLKFKPDGELIFAEETVTGFGNLRIEKDGFYVQTNVNASFNSFLLYNDTIPGCFNPDKPIGVKSILLKFDNYGKLIWYYIVEGCSQGSVLNGFDIKDGIVSCSYDILDADLELQGIPYKSEGKSIAMINLDSRTGSLLGHFLTPIDNWYWNSRFLERQEDGSFRAFVSIWEGDNYYGMPLGNPNSTISYFVDFKLDINTNTDEKAPDDYDLNVFPNPVSDIISFQFQPAINKPINLRILNLTGQIVLKEKFDSTETQFQINVNDLSPGIYFYEIQSDFKMIGTGKLMVK